MIDVLLILWVILWVSIAFFVAAEIRGLRRLSETVAASGEMLHETGNILDSLGDLPLIGEGVDVAEQRVREAANSARTSAESSRRNIETLSVLLGISIALVPTLPLVAIYVSLRISRAREVVSIKRALRRFGDDPSFHEFLARRATERLGYHHLRDVSVNPWRDLEMGYFERLSAAELKRLGIRSRRRKPSRAR